MHYPLPSEINEISSAPSWPTLCKQVYDRDSAQCHVCGVTVPWSVYECGHIIDRVCGGSDRLSNLVTMCKACNRMKPCHSNRAEYIDWLDAGDWRNDIIARLATLCGYESLL